MGTVILLRTMTYKSKIEGGKWEGCAVQDLINTYHFRALRYMYYNYSKITFIPEILETIGIPDEFLISKPGKNPELANKLNDLKIDNMSFKARVHSERRDKYKKLYRERKILKETLLSKGKLQSLNHNH